MILREAIRQLDGFRFMVEQLPVCSAPGRRFLYDSLWMTAESEVRIELNRVAEVLDRSRGEEGQNSLQEICEGLRQIRDIQGTIRHTGEAVVLDDLELFELKNFALVTDRIRVLIRDWEGFDIPNLRGVIDLLDPERNRIPHFYIYDSYSEKLAARRACMKLRRQQGASEQEIEQLYLCCLELEDEVRECLSQNLREYHRILEQAMEQVALLDIVVAKAEQATRMHLTCPELTAGKMVFYGLFNPRVQEVLVLGGKAFQPVNLQMGQEVTLISGANMTGKSVLLKTVALAQYLLQFGFYIPAMKAEMVLVDEVQINIGDEQDELNGLSSFAAEMLRVNEIIAGVRVGRRILVLLDELARTTNPLEGRAIVNGVVDFLTENQVMALVTTHYNGIIAPCHRLRVRGFIEGRHVGKVNLKNINEFIDYSLEEDCGETVPHEAMRIAALLGVDNNLLDRAAEYLRESDLDVDKTVQ